MGEKVPEANSLFAKYRFSPQLEARGDHEPATTRFRASTGATKMQAPASKAPIAMPALRGGKLRMQKITIGIKQTIALPRVSSARPKKIPLKKNSRQCLWSRARIRK